jgi:hypothetical protein
VVGKRHTGRKSQCEACLPSTLDAMVIHHHAVNGKHKHIDAHIDALSLWRSLSPTELTHILLAFAGKAGDLLVLNCGPLAELGAPLLHRHAATRARMCVSNGTDHRRYRHTCENAREREGVCVCVCACLRALVHVCTCVCLARVTVSAGAEWTCLWERAGGRNVQGTVGRRTKRCRGRAHSS